jgi:hypothetical protein
MPDFKCNEIVKYYYIVLWREAIPVPVIGSLFHYRRGGLIREVIPVPVIGPLFHYRRGGLITGTGMASLIRPPLL